MSSGVKVSGVYRATLAPMSEPLRPERERSPAETIEAAFEALGIDAAHDAEVEREAAALAANARAALDDPALVELRALPFVTIDGAGARDLDQALHLARDGAGYRLRYALADAAHYVRPGSALFAAALERGASHYAPGRTAPMLPRTLSEDLVSLGPGVARRAVVFDLRLDAEARTLATTVLRARVESRAKLDYVSVQRWLDGEDGAAIDETYAESLRLLREVGEKRRARARERGAVAFDRRETEIVVAGRPPRFVARERERPEAEAWNAELSLLCNAEGAALLAGLEAATGRDDDDGLHPIYRVHAAPLERRLAELRRRLDEWARSLALDDVWRWRDGQTLGDYLGALPRRNAGDTARALAVERQVLVTQRASEFRAEPGRHHALAVDAYARFSSPMREIVGVFVHKELLEALERGDGGAPSPGFAPGTAPEDAPPDGTPSADAPFDGRSSADGTPVETRPTDRTLRARVIDAANAARRRQRALDKRVGFAVIADLLESDLEGDPVPARAGTVLGIRADGTRGADTAGHLYVGIDALALDLKVYAEDLARRHGGAYAFDAHWARPREGAGPRFALGDEVTLRAAGYDAARGRFTLDVVPRGEAARRERRRARPA